MKVNDPVWAEVSRDRERLGIIKSKMGDMYQIKFDSTELLYDIDKKYLRVADTTGSKNDTEKVRLELIPPEAITAMGEAFTFGAIKYSPDDWRGGMDWRRLIGASLRHINAFNSGEDNDSESGLSHLAHAGACISMLIGHVEKGLGKDDRYRSNKTKD